MKFDEYSGNREIRSVGNLIEAAIDELGLSEGFLRQRVYEAWDNVSGAGKYTLDRYFRAGTLYVRLSSAVVRNKLMLSVEAIRGNINLAVTEDGMFIPKDGDKNPVKNIVLQ